MLTKLIARFDSSFSLSASLVREAAQAEEFEHEEEDEDESSKSDS